MNNPHRNTWRGQPGERGRRCGCGFLARTVKDQREHADLWDAYQRQAAANG